MLQTFSLRGALSTLSGFHRLALCNQPVSVLQILMIPRINEYFKGFTATIFFSRDLNLYCLCTEQKSYQPADGV